MPGDGDEFAGEHGAQPRGRARRFLFTDDPAHGVHAGARKFPGVERSFAREQFVEQHAERIDVAARVNVQPAHLGLLGTHVGRRADELPEGGEHGFVREPLIRRGLGNTEVNHLGHGQTVVPRDENVRRLDVAVNDSFLMRVLDGLADLDKQREALFHRKAGLVAKIRDADAAHQFHDEIRPARFRRARVEHPGDVRMIHECQRLALGLEACDDLPRVHAGLDDLESDAALDRLALFGRVNLAEPALADFLQQLVAPDHLAGQRLDWERCGGGAGFVRAEGVRSLEETGGGLLERLQEQFNTLAERGILTADLLEVRRALLRRKVQHSLEEGFFQILGIVHGIGPTAIYQTTRYLGRKRIRRSGFPLFSIPRNLS